MRTVNINGVNIYVRTNSPDLNVAIASLFENESDHIRCSNPKIIIDAGPNIGTSSIFFAKKYPYTQIIAIEPESNNFDLLVKNTSNYKNIIVIKAAIWGATGQRTIQDRFTGHGGFTVSDTHTKTESTGQEIDCIPIKSLMEEHRINTIDLLKMDIEGG